MERLLKIREVAAILSIHVKTCYELAGRGELPGLKRIGSALRVNPETLRAWLSEQPKKGKSK